MKAALLITWILLSQWQLSSACKCLVLHIQELFCDSDFVIKGVVTSRKPHTLDTETARLEDDGDQLRKYKVKVKLIYKAPAGIGKKIIVKSQLESAACGVYLDLDTPYLLSGKMTPDGLILRRCSSLAMKWKELNSSQRKYLKKGKYKDSCDCEIQICRGDEEECDPKSARLNECILGYDLPSAECYRRTAFCGRSEGMCVWDHEKPFKRCMKKQA